MINLVKVRNLDKVFQCKFGLESFQSFGLFLIVASVLESFQSFGLLWMELSVLESFQSFGILWNLGGKEFLLKGKL